MDVKELTEALSKMLQAGLFTTIGAIAHYLRQIDTEGEQFKTLSFITNAFVAFVVGNIVVDFLPSYLQGHEGGVLLMCGFFCYPILDTLEKRLMKHLGK